MEKRADGWYFVHDAQDLGPYDTRAEAEADKRGLDRWDRHKDEPGFLTVDPALISELLK